MAYKVLIPTAGTGSRLGGMTKYLNKSLIGIGNKPALARIIEMFPDDTEYVIPIGYKGELVKEFVALAYPQKKITFVEVSPYEGTGSGLGLSICLCKEYLQCPFIFCSCDTLVNEQIAAPDHNWMGYDERDNREQYRTLSIADKNVIRINEKGAGDENAKPYIGLAGIFDYQAFWERMDASEICIAQGESYGLQELIKTGIEAKKFTWFDTGVKVELEATRKRYAVLDAPNILEKENEAIWFLDDKVIKYSDDIRFIADRITRAELLKGFVPAITAFTKHMYCYQYITGSVMSGCVTLPVFERLLEFSKSFWAEKKLEETEKLEFYRSCMNFYKTKTYQRVELFYSNFSKCDNVKVINDISYPSLEELLGQVDWDNLAQGLPGQFHGDYHFENIIYNKEKNSFEFIDWRQNFGDSLSIGDIYYDLAKLLHGLLMCHELVAKDLISIEWKDGVIRYDFARKHVLVECEKVYYQWLENNGYDVKKVKMLTAIIFLNIAALHHDPYSLVLYALGKEMLYANLKEDKNA